MNIDKKYEENNIFEFSNLTAGYGNNIVLQNINLGIKKNDFIAILGTNGSGKTSLINSIFGVCKHINGEILFNGFNIKDLKIENIAKNIAAVPQTVNLAYNFLVKDFVDLGLIAGDDYKKDFDRTSSDCSLFEIEGLLKIDDLLNKKIMELSSGEFQRVLLAQSLIKNPKIIFLDEPLAHLDLKYQFEILHILQKLNQNGMIIIVIIHDLKLALQFFDRFVFFKDGEIFEDVLN